jgi:hypothetical protein
VLCFSHYVGYAAVASATFAALLLSSRSSPPAFLFVLLCKKKKMSLLHPPVLFPFFSCPSFSTARDDSSRAEFPVFKPACSWCGLGGAGYHRRPALYGDLTHTFVSLGFSFFLFCILCRRRDGENNRARWQPPRCVRALLLVLFTTLSTNRFTKELRRCALPRVYERQHRHWKAIGKKKHSNTSSKWWRRPSRATGTADSVYQSLTRGPTRGRCSCLASLSPPSFPRVFARHVRRVGYGRSELLFDTPLKKKASFFFFNRHQSQLFERHLWWVRDHEPVLFCAFSEEVSVPQRKKTSPTKLPGQRTRVEGRKGKKGKKNTKKKGRQRACLSFVFEGRKPQSYPYTHNPSHSFFFFVCPFFLPTRCSRRTKDFFFVFFFGSFNSPFLLVTALLALFTAAVCVRGTHQQRQRRQLPQR